MDLIGYSVDRVVQQMEQAVTEMLNAGESRDAIVTATNGIAFDSARSQQLSQAPPTPIASPFALTASSSQLSELTSEQQPSDKCDRVVQQMEQAVTEMLNARESRDAIVTAINGIAFDSARSQQLSQALLSKSVIVGSFFYALASNAVAAGVTSLMNSSMSADEFSSEAGTYI